MYIYVYVYILLWLDLDAEVLVFPPVLSSGMFLLAADFRQDPTLLSNISFSPPNPLTVNTRCYVMIGL